ncbi:MAG: helix-turn-helix domain-containing protein [Pseudomonadales bacterium]|nr:helix-turn-helix domain-containing protein [Pseudomonadales bacterium]
MQRRCDYAGRCCTRWRQLTQTDMAEALGVGQSYVSKLERGENYIDVLLFARWCAACGVKAGKVLDGLLR